MDHHSPSLFDLLGHGSRVPDGGTGDDLIRGRIRGLVLGQAVGDALGLPYEGLSPRRANRLLGPPDKHRFMAGRGMVSDDTEHLCMAAQALLSHPSDADAFALHLARKLRWWLLALPAGTGLATLRAITRLWIGFGPSSSGVFSAGNGPAMRGAVLGACLGGDPERMRSFVKASTLLTHTDPKALEGAAAVAAAAAAAVGRGTGYMDAARLLAGLRERSSDPEFVGLLDEVENSLVEGLTVSQFAGVMGLKDGVSGYMYHTVPVVLFAFLRHLGDYRETVRSVIRLGGDTDTTGAIAGALAGAAAGEEAIPPEWIRGVVEWPRTTAWMLRLADRLAALEKGRSPGPHPLFWPWIIPRNILFMVVVLGHGFRRMLPPY